MVQSTMSHRPASTSTLRLMRQRSSTRRVLGPCAQEWHITQEMSAWRGANRLRLIRPLSSTMPRWDPACSAVPQKTYVLWQLPTANHADSGRSFAAAPAPAAAGAKLPASPQLALASRAPTRPGSAELAQQPVAHCGAPPAPRATAQPLWCTRLCLLDADEGGAVELAAAEVHVAAAGCQRDQVQAIQGAATAPGRAERLATIQGPTPLPDVEGPAQILLFFLSPSAASVGGWACRQQRRPSAAHLLAPCRTLHQRRTLDPNLQQLA